MTPRVLIADDSQFARSSARKGLDETQMAIEEAATGPETLAACRSFRPDILLLDLNMPELSGYDVMEALAHDAVKPIIVVISAQIQPVAIQRAKELGATAFLQKPIAPAKLASMLEYLWREQKRARDAASAARPPAAAPRYSAQELDILAELVNVGMGRAAASLAALLDEYVELSVPRASFLSELVARWEREVKESLVVSQQAFFGDVQGEVITMYRMDEVQNLRALFHRDGDMDVGELEFVLDVTNILNGACLGSIANQLQAKIQYCQPSLLSASVSIAELGRQWTERGEHLAIEIAVRVDTRRFTGNVLVILPPVVEQRVRDAIVKLMAA